MFRIQFGLAIVAGFFLCGSITAFAQEAVTKAPSEPKLFVGLTIGGSAGLDDFGKVNFPNGSDKINGFASSGYRADLQGGYYVIPNLAFAAQIGFSNYFGNTNKYQSELKARSSLPLNEVSEASVENFTYNGLHFMVGPRLSYPVGTIELYAQPMIGYALLNNPSMAFSTKETITGTNETVTRKFSYQDTKINAGLANGISIGLRTSTKRKIGFLLDINYLSYGIRELKTNIKLENETVRNINGTLTTLPTVTTTGPLQVYTMMVTTVSASFGVAISF
jgi:hypothetical protein